jgi:hypothetical protein
MKTCRYWLKFLPLIKHVKTDISVFLDVWKNCFFPKILTVEVLKMLNFEGLYVGAPTTLGRCKNGFRYLLWSLISG